MAIINPTEDQLNEWLSQQTMRGTIGGNRLADLAIPPSQLAAMQQDNMAGGDAGVKYTIPQNYIQSSSGNVIPLQSIQEQGGMSLNDLLNRTGASIKDKVEIQDKGIGYRTPSGNVVGLDSNGRPWQLEGNPRPLTLREAMAQVEYQTKIADLQKKQMEISGKPDANKMREDADALRKEFNALQEVKNYKEVVPIINSARKAPDTPAGDFQLIYGVGKILDPNSVVREGEMNMVIKAGSPAQRVQGYLDYLQGRGRLTPQLRKELTDMLEFKTNELGSLYESTKGTYEGIAKKRGHDSADIFTGIPSMEAPAKKAQYQDGQESRSKSGRPIIFRNGNWEYK